MKTYKERMYWKISLNLRERRCRILEYSENNIKEVTVKLWGMTVLSEIILLRTSFLPLMWLAGNSLTASKTKRSSSRTRLNGFHNVVLLPVPLAARSKVCVCCQVEVCAKSWSLIQGSPNDCGAS